MREGGKRQRDLLEATCKFYRSILQVSYFYVRYITGGRYITTHQWLHYTSMVRTTTVMKMDWVKASYDGYWGIVQGWGPRGSKQRGTGVNEPTARHWWDLAVKEGSSCRCPRNLFFIPTSTQGWGWGERERELGKWHAHRHEGKKKHLFVGAWHSLLVTASLLTYHR